METIKKFNLTWALNAAVVAIGWSLYDSGLFDNTYKMLYDLGYFFGSALMPFVLLFIMGGAVGMPSESRKWGQKSTIWWVCVIAGSILVSLISWRMR
jgi:hypothetical protein